jgi:short-subunit dehydrogenase
MAHQNGLALVTGASSGIGLELARILAQEGYDLIVVAEDDGIHEVASELASGKREVDALQHDLRLPQAVEDVYASVRRTGRPLDVVALNAGTGRAGRFIDDDLRADMNIVDLNVRSAVHLAKLVLPAMVQRGSGKVLFTSSIVAMMPGSYQSMYNASKSFIQSFAEALHDELRDTGVTVTALMPGPTDTDFFRRTGMLDTLLGQMPGKDDPAKVARQGFDAMMRGDQKVSAESVLTKAISVASRVLPDSVKAAANRVITTPRDGTEI